MSDELTTEQVREIAQDVLNEWLPGYCYAPGVPLDQIQLRQMADGSYRADPADGPRAEGALGIFRIAVTVDRVDLPVGLCGDKGDHEPHDVLTGSLAPFRCSANQSTRLPHAAERRRNG